ncbi:MAG: STAS domain-containing protein [Clostridia bacterium]|nr:STAS domain-containing protein [Clostridia bacterium]
MFKTEYHFEVKKRDWLLVVRLFGEIDHHGAVTLREDLDRLILKERPRRLVLDLSLIEFMDSAGLGLLMGRYRLMQDIGGVMVLSRPNQRIMKILRLSGMERFMEIEGVGAKGEQEDEAR